MELLTRPAKLGIFLNLIVLSGAAAAQADWYPSKYGADDTIGAANNLSEAGVVNAAGLVKLGKT